MIRRRRSIKVSLVMRYKVWPWQLISAPLNRSQSPWISSSVTFCTRALIVEAKALLREPFLDVLELSNQILHILTCKHWMVRRNRRFSRSARGNLRRISVSTAPYLLFAAAFEPDDFFDSEGSLLELLRLGFRRLLYVGDIQVADNRTQFRFAGGKSIAGPFFVPAR